MCRREQWSISATSATSSITVVDAVGVAVM
jgi:hypothetical protein